MSIPGGHTERRTRTDLQGRTLVGGAHSRTWFARMLNVDPQAGEQATRVVAVGWMGDHAEVELAAPGNEPVVLHFERAQPNQPRLVNAEHVSVHYRGPKLWGDLEQRLRKVRLGTLTVEDLAAAVGNDPDVQLSKDRLPQQGGTDQASFDEKSLLSTWGSKAAWSQFFAVAEVSRGRLDSLDIFERGNFIQHCDRDCLLVTPKGPVPMVERVFYPWQDRVRKIGQPARRLANDANTSRRRSSIRTTDLRERDVVMGSTDKLERVVKQVLAEGVDDMLFLSCTCVPFVTGEDVESLVKRYRPQLDRPFFFLTTTPQSSEGVFREVLVKERLDAEKAARPAVAHTVNLIGYARGPTLDELTALMQQAGVELNVTFIPEMNFQAVTRLPRAPVHILYPNVLWESIYDQLLFESRLQAVTPPAPYGQKATTEWLAQVAKAADRSCDAGAIVRRAAEPYQAELAAIRREAAKHRLGFVVVADEVHRLCDPAGTWGVPLLQLVEELGFGVDVMIRVEDRATAQQSAQKVHQMFAEPARHSIKAFKDVERLTMLLETSACEAVYSDHLFDRRLSSAGKAQFSLQEFELGLAGLVRTGQRLLDVCRLPLYRRYRKYLPKDEIAAGGPP